MSGFLGAFATTVVVEAAVVAAAAPRGARLRTARDSVFANAFTHPLAWAAVVELAMPFWWVEAAVWGVELAIYRAVSRHALGRAAALATLANGATVLLALWAW